jgi:hypothetical protein
LPFRLRPVRPTTLGLLRPPKTSEVVDTFAQQNSLKFWMRVILTGVGAGLSAALLYVVLKTVQHWAWPVPNVSLLQAAAASGPWRHVLVLLGAGLL